MVQPPPTAGHTGRRQRQYHPPRSTHGHKLPILATAATDPPASPRRPADLAGSSTSALAMLPEMLTAREAAAILRVGRNQLYQAVARGELGAIRIGRSIRIPKQALLGLLAAAGRPTASGDEQPR